MELDGLELEQNFETGFFDVKAKWDGGPTYSFYDARWSGPFMNLILIVAPRGLGTLNPLGFPTKMTGLSIFDNVIRPILNKPENSFIDGRLDFSDKSAGPYKRTPQGLFLIRQKDWKADEFKSITIGDLAVAALKWGFKSAQIQFESSMIEELRSKI